MLELKELELGKPSISENKVEKGIKTSQFLSVLKKTPKNCFTMQFTNSDELENESKKKCGKLN